MLWINYLWIYFLYFLYLVLLSVSFFLFSNILSIFWNFRNSWILLSFNFFNFGFYIFGIFKFFWIFDLISSKNLCLKFFLILVFQYVVHEFVVYKFVVFEFFYGKWKLEQKYIFGFAYVYMLLICYPTFITMNSYNILFLPSSQLSPLYPGEHWHV